MNMDSLPDGTVMIKAKGVTALVRDGTSDRFIVQEVISGNTYRRLNVTEGDTVLDIGMNIGMFSIFIAGTTSRASMEQAYAHSDSSC